MVIISYAVNSVEEGVVIGKIRKLRGTSQLRGIRVGVSAIVEFIERIGRISKK